MEYTVQKLAKLAGVTARTLRYYDEIGILKPVRMNASGYRIYGTAEVDRLQQILFYRELGVALEYIREILDDPGFSGGKALIEHREKLLERRKQLDLLIANVEKTISASEGTMDMQDLEKFEGFKKAKLEENEVKYGKEIRSRYGDETVDRSNETFQNMTKEQHEAAVKLEQEMKSVLAEAFITGDPAGSAAQKAADLHKQWLSHYWPEYSKEAHAGLADMYTEDERFKAYYDEQQTGLAEFLRDAIHVYTGQKK
ncbi:MerR family transcriptional regulator [Bacillus sp. FJAT-42376]|uniref:MerR family transcriptional regulator n=1 Tax=Bacillus sp. FJAT-42376 TaxID=2014076 RepID=UPI000F4E6076|nr:MerR family transcriptional regulator [Bacillus sp. FJAT-42376]AZB42095.1 MerR family transcriptional regulator [Bacillus sp. FJAT-42376]